MSNCVSSNVLRGIRLTEAEEVSPTPTGFPRHVRNALSSLANYDNEFNLIIYFFALLDAEINKTILPKSSKVGTNELEESTRHHWVRQQTKGT